MATADERIKILKMIEDGKITAEDGARLLSALSDTRKTPPPPPNPITGGGEARWFRVRVTDLNTGKTKVNINVPAGLVNVGIKMGARFAPGVEADQMALVMEALKSGASGKILDVTEEETNEHIEIFVE